MHSRPRLLPLIPALDLINVLIYKVKMHFTEIFPPL
jgi:hypothetical protein